VYRLSGLNLDGGGIVCLRFGDVVEQLGIDCSRLAVEWRAWFPVRMREGIVSSPPVSRHVQRVMKDGWPRTLVRVSAPAVWMEERREEFFTINVIHFMS
jgi:hypothetical protein